MPCGDLVRLLRLARPSFNSGKECQIDLDNAGPGLERLDAFVSARGSSLPLWQVV